MHFNSNACYRIAELSPLIFIKLLYLKHIIVNSKCGNRAIFTAYSLCCFYTTTESLYRKYDK